MLPRLIAPTRDYTACQSLIRIVRRVRAYSARAKAQPRVAVLGSFTTGPLVSLIDLFLWSARVDATFYESDYGIYRQELLDPTSSLYEFRPTVVIIATTWRDVGHRPGLGETGPGVASMVAAEVDEWALLWKSAYERSGCQVIQNNFDIPPWRSLGNHENRHPASLGRYLGLLNQALQDHAPPFVTIHDVDHLAMSWGRWKWSDERFFHEAKLPCAPEYLVDYAHSLTSLILAQSGVNKKCLVLDLDNTLWGGVIGDEGLGGIRLGQGDPEGEAFLSFQRYVKSLRERGVILAVCSKNTDQIARQPFEKHPEMVLRLADISSFVANWDDKAKNLNTIACELNIGLDSLVFVDDDPTERSIARQFVPDVAVPEIPEDPAGYIEALERHRYFQIVSVSNEDLKRTDFYRAENSRKDAEALAGGDVHSFLRSLDMIASVEPITAVTLDRSVQLINKSNQFNLTSRRYSTAEVLAMLADEAWVTRTVAIKDRFGDHGLISVLLARVQGGCLLIDTWLMSCRVLKRGVENLLLNHIYNLAQSRELSAIVGEYLPTPKNELVRDHFSRLEFTKLGETEDGSSTWKLTVDPGRPPLPHFIREASHHGEPGRAASRPLPNSV